MSGPLPLRFVLSAPDLAALPPTPAEVAIVGRSNVGKSTLINAIAGRKALAQVSNTPGRTRFLNLYDVDGGGTVMDLPGYGYAKASKATRATWPAMIERYLLGRDGLAMVIVLLDGEIGPTKLDLAMLDWLRAHALPHQVVATKHDKVKSSHRVRRQRELAAGCQLEPGDVVWVSAVKGTGIDRLRTLVRSYLSP